MTINFGLRESDPEELKAYVLTISTKEGVLMNLYLWSGDIARLEKAIKEAGF